ncbi:MAG: hypothetical protein AAF478_10730 [Pseudomonadota bacterium]
MRKLIQIAFTLAVTALVCWGAWYLWNEVPRWLRRTELSDYSYLASLLAIFLALSLLNPLVIWVWGRISDEEEH